MTWEQLSVNKPHWVYLILGGFTSLFMLCSLFVKEKMYIGEATVATLCGVIFGPHAANLFNPLSWGNTDQITLECSRVVLVVQCFAVGVELPKAYMERHWRSVVFLLVPVMTFGWLMTSLFIWWMIVPLTWLESLACAACVTATDPVLASSVVGKGKFAKRVPKHLRDVLSAESGCNDGMAFPFIYLSFYLIRYRPHASEVFVHWFVHTVLYECIFGAIYGVLIGYLGRHAIKWADRKDLIDRESFLVFYFTLALFCAGTGATLGTDDLLVGFAAGVGFSNDGWFTEKTEESHVSNVIDLLLNLAYFVYLGAIIPWDQFNNPLIGLTPWRLVVIAIFVILFRRIPIMMALKPVIPDIKTWREALFAGHFGPIGVGAIFAAILARAELETDTTEPLAVVPSDPNSENYAIVQIIWPLTTFLVISSILVHGSSIAVFTLGKRINSFTLTMSYTQANEEGPSWMNRLPRIASTMSKGSMSKGRDDFSAASSIEKPSGDYPPGILPPIGMPGTFLRRQAEEDTPIEKPRAARRKSKWDSGLGPGGPIEQSAITPQRRSPRDASTSESLLNEKASTLNSSEEEDKIEPSPESGSSEDVQKPRKGPHTVKEPELEVYEEGHKMIVEDEEGNTIGVHDIKGESAKQKRQHVLDDEEKLRKDKTGEFAKDKHHPHEKNEGKEIEQGVEEAVEHPEQATKNLFKRLGAWDGFKRKEKEDITDPTKPLPSNSVPARAYQFGNTLIVEDEDGEVLKKIDLTSPTGGRGRGGVQNSAGLETAPVIQSFKRMGNWAGLGSKSQAASASASTSASAPAPPSEAPEQSAEGSSEADVKARKKSIVSAEVGDEDDRLRFTVGTGGRRMSKQEFVEQLYHMDPKARRDTLASSRPSVGGRRESETPQIGPQRPSLRSSLSSYTGRARSDSGRARADSRRSPTRPTLSPLEEHAPTSAPVPGLDDADPNDPESLQIVRRLSTHSERSHIAPSATSAEHNELHNTDTNNVPTQPGITDAVRKASEKRSSDPTAPRAETAAQRRRRVAMTRRDSDDDGTERIPPQHSPTATRGRTIEPQGETDAERRRRLAALGEDSGAEESDSEDDGGMRRVAASSSLPGTTADSGANTDTRTGAGATGSKEAGRVLTGIRFADAPAVSQGRIQWGEGVGEGVKGKSGSGDEGGSGSGNGGRKSWLNKFK